MEENIVQYILLAKYNRRLDLQGLFPARGEEQKKNDDESVEEVFGVERSMRDEWKTNPNKCLWLKEFDWCLRLIVVLFEID